MSVLHVLAKRRFNYIDSFCCGWIGAHLALGNYPSAAITFLVGVVISVLAERLSALTHGEELKGGGDE